jgi:hypothetical protein
MGAKYQFCVGYQVKFAFSTNKNIIVTNKPNLLQCSKVLLAADAGNTKGGGITLPLTSCLTGLD